MKVLVIGGGGREHAVIKALKKSSQITEIYAAPGNGGISMDALCVPIKSCDIKAMTGFAVEKKIDYVVVTPDDPLSIGMVDEFEKLNIKCFGPDKKAARIESSKVFAKSLMKKYGIPTARYESFSNPDKAQDYLISDNVSYPVVIKADGLALGKGVTIAEDKKAAMQAVNSIMKEKKFGESGNSIVIEEFLKGPEVSALVFTDGKTISPMVSSMDHKRAHDGNKGPNTGGMGAIAPNPHYSKEMAELCMKTIFLPSIQAMQNEGCPFKGCLYFGLMLTDNEPMVIEYNCRFGDPETQAIIPLLKTDLFEIMQAITDEKLEKINIQWLDAHTACVILTSGGYPDAYKTGFPITGLDGDNQDNTIIYHSGTEFLYDNFVTKGGRVLGITSTAQTLDLALEAAYKKAETIHFEGMYYRKDIGKY